jgi:hypothetical protein
VSQEYDDPREQRAAELLRLALSGEEPKGPEEPGTERAVAEALSTAAFLRSTAQPGLGADFLAGLGRELEAEARQRQRRRQRMTLFGGASLAALAASILLLAGPILRPRPEPGFEARYPKPPVLTQEIQPGSDPLPRLDPVYEAGLRGYREARFLGAHHAYSAAQ